jgi:ankyrin repeat protein
MDINKRDGMGSTPLHWAAISNSANTFRFLLAMRDLLIDAIDDDGLTPLHLAVMNAGETKDLTMVKILIAKGASP